VNRTSRCCISGFCVIALEIDVGLEDRSFDDFFFFGFEFPVQVDTPPGVCSSA
jgi:hypothetical protein